jgi:hypothetical protein
MRTTKLFSLVLGTFVSCAAVFTAGDALSSPAPTGQGKGFSAIYGNVPADQAEFLSTPDAIISIASSGAPMAIWETLEHGERVECLNCVGAVAPLMYDANARTREIAAWWLRRRIFGVFGPGEVYQQTLNTLATDGNAQRRAYAAYAVGEFLEGAGVSPLATALKNDPDAGVRTAAASALGRLNDDGGGALGTAFGDRDPGVKYAALAAAGRINSFTGIAGVATLAGDGDVNVRRQAMLLLGEMGAKDSIGSVMALAKTDPDMGVRIAACHALGAFGDMSALSTLQGIAANDSSSLVRDAANIAILRL